MRFKISPARELPEQSRLTAPLLLGLKSRRGNLNFFFYATRPRCQNPDVRAVRLGIIVQKKRCRSVKIKSCSCAALNSDPQSREFSSGIWLWPLKSQYSRTHQTDQEINFHRRTGLSLSQVKWCHEKTHNPQAGHDWVRFHTFLADGGAVHMQQESESTRNRLAARTKSNTRSLLLWTLSSCEEIFLFFRFQRKIFTRHEKDKHQMNQKNQIA